MPAAVVSLMTRGSDQGHWVVRAGDTGGAPGAAGSCASQWDLPGAELLGSLALFCCLSWSCLSVFLFSTALPLCMQATPVFLSSLGALKTSSGSLLRSALSFLSSLGKTKQLLCFFPCVFYFFCPSFCHFFLKLVVLLI